ncbi:MAG: polyphosphate polymerase domain-containing protein [Deltaproteobacteria bacterium]|nr:polyphosphate polymerase domain-containing protein [Deltaproteobacteria bacterium]
MRLERLELKYTIPLSLVDAIADYASCYCSPDKYSPEGGGYYTVNSLYLDSPGFALLKNRLERRANRVNLRIRSYGELADPPYHLEIKQKVGSVVRKYRATVADDPGTLLESDMLDRADVARDDRENLELFALLHASYGLEPKVLMTYRRRALNSDVDDYARVTFDTELRCAWRDRYRLTHDAGEFSACDLPEFYDPGCSVVLELKCYAAHLPCWMLDLVKQFSLRRRSFSKYLAAAAQTTTAARYAGDRRSSAVWL